MNKNFTLKPIWELRLDLRKKAGKLSEEIQRLKSKSDKLSSESFKLDQEARKIACASRSMIEAGNKTNTEWEIQKLESQLLAIESQKILSESLRLGFKSKALLEERAILKLELDRLYNLSDRIWLRAVLKAYGNIKIEWIFRGLKGSACKLPNGEIFEP
jgi:hypothetical protein